MKNSIGILCFLICVLTAQAQEEKKQFIRKGLIRSQATISPGMMLDESNSTISIHGGLEYYVADNVSVRGDSYYFLASDKDFLDLNFATFSGVSYHFKTQNHFDPYFTFAPGIAIVGASSKCPDGAFCDPPVVEVTYKTSANPLLTAGMGFNFYFQRFFHLFGEARYIGGKYLSDAPKPLSLNELRFSFGLGFNLNLLKKK